MAETWGRGEGALVCPGDEPGNNQVIFQVKMARDEGSGAGEEKNSEKEIHLSGGMVAPPTCVKGQSGARALFSRVSLSLFLTCLV